MWGVDTADPPRLCSLAIESHGTGSSTQFGAPGTLIRRWLRRNRARDRFFKEFWNKTHSAVVSALPGNGKKEHEMKDLRPDLWRGAGEFHALSSAATVQIGQQLEFKLAKITVEPLPAELQALVQKLERKLEGK
jgi:hypothetical protein